VACAMASVVPARVIAHLTSGLRRLTGVDGLRMNLRGWDGGLSRTTWLGLALDEVGISGDGDLWNLISGSSTKGASSSLNSKGGGGVGDRSTIIN
jgi:hypothetical protein